MVYYVLQTHARDVNISENFGDIGRHTGYDLIAYEGNNIISIQSLDLGLNGGNIEILYRKSPNYQEVSYNGLTQIWNNQTHIDNGWENVDQSMAEAKRFETSRISLSSNEALKAFNNMLLNAKFLNALGNINKAINYKALGPNCNTWTNTMAQDYLGGQNVFNGFSVGTYVGSGTTIENASSGNDKKQYQLVEWYITEFKNHIQDKNIDYGNAIVTLKKSNTDWVCFINNCTVDGKLCNFAFDNDASNIITIPLNSNNTYIYAGNGENIVNSGKGNDYIEGGKDRDIIYGGAGNDEIYGNEGNNDLYGDAGNDKIYGGSGIDKVYTGAGNDKVYTGAGNDEVNTKDGGSKNDENIVFLGKGSDTFTGGSGKDNVDGGSGFTSDQTVISAADMTDGEGDTNTVHLGGGDDYYTGGKGTDKVWGEADSDIIHGGEGNDFLYGGDGDDYLYGEDGNDTIEGGQGNDYIDSGAGDDIIDSGSGSDTRNNTNTINLGTGADKFTGSLGVDIVTSDLNDTSKKIVNLGGNSDTYEGSAGRDEVNGGQGADRASDINIVNLGAGSDDYVGGDGQDIVDGGSSYGGRTVDSDSDTNTISLGGGEDFYRGGDGKDIVHGGKQGDYIYGGGNDDKLYGEQGNDTLVGNNGNNTLDGGSGNDDIYGGDDNDIIYAGTGADYINAGKGTNTIDLGKDNMCDKVVITNSGNGVDIIKNYNEYDYWCFGNNNSVTSSEQRGRDLYIHCSLGNTIIFKNYGEDPEDPEDPQGADGLPYYVDDDGNMWGWMPGGDGTDGGYVDTGFDLPKNGNGSTPLEPGKQIPKDENGIPVGEEPNYPPKKNDPPQGPSFPPVDGPGNNEGDEDPYDQDGNEGAEPGSLKEPGTKLPWDGQPHPSTDPRKPVTLGNLPGGWSNPGPLVNGLPEKYKDAEETKSPLVIDLDGDGIETIGKDAGVYFDHGGDGFVEKTGWVGKDDGLLVYDRNNNGKIDDGTELFGNNTILSNGKKALNGFEALKELDTNFDNKFDKNDVAWNDVKIWKDSNSNGIVDIGEMITLSNAGISYIDLAYQEQQYVDSNNNEHSQTSQIVKNDGTRTTISDVWFNSNPADTVDTIKIDIPDDIKALPNIKGFGNVHDLHIAMALDTTGELKALVNQYVNTTDSEARDTILLNIIYHWTGVQDMDPNGRDPTQIYSKVIDDTRKLEALEEFMGKDYLGTWCWGERDPNPHGQAAPKIIRMFDEIVSFAKQQLLIQTDYQPLLMQAEVSWNETTHKWEANDEKLIAALQARYEADPANGDQMMSEFGRILGYYGDMGFDFFVKLQAAGNEQGTPFEQALADFGTLRGTNNNDQIVGTDNVDVITGMDGNDRIYGNGGADIISGDSGDDTIFGDDGDDQITGGTGNDYLNGGNGTDTYFFEAGFGHDTLDNLAPDDTVSNDIIQFGEGILPENIELQRQGYDLIINVSYTPEEGETTARPNDSLRIYSYFDEQGTTTATVNNIIFADGTTWNYEYIVEHWNSVPGIGGGVTIEGTNNDDTISGTNANDVLIGRGGNDTINAGEGNDTIQGGTGNDILSGGTGDDTYLWNWGDGLDTISDSGNRDRIVFGANVYYSDLKFRQEGDNLRIIIKNNESQGMILTNFFSSNLAYKIEDIQFANGQTLHLSEMKLTLHQLNSSETIHLTGNGDTVYANGGNDTIYGGQGNDIIYGGDGNDTIDAGEGNDIIYGGKGNDTINGGAGADTYVWNLGDDLDTLTYASSIDKIVFGSGISFGDLTFRNDNGDLRIIINGDETQGLICKEFFQNDDKKASQIIFNDGSTFPLSTSALTLVQKDSSETVTDTAYNDTIYGNAGDDTITCGDGNDTIYGGSGNDTINSGNGNDTIIGGKGDDAMNGNSGADTYIYNLGDGLDTIWASNADTLVFGEGISLSDLTFRKEGNNLRIIINGSETDGIIDIDYYRSNQNQFKEIHFADGSIVDLRDIGFTMNQNNSSEIIEGTAFADVINGNDGNDTIEARGGNDIINGGLGDDIIRGYEGNDTITGGRGNDALDGGTGDDVFIYNLGDGFDTIYDAAGNDTIRFGNGISFDDLKFRQEDKNLIITIGDSSDQGMLIYNMMDNHSYDIERLEFADGTVKYLSPMGLTLNQNETSETINGTNYDDIINASGGNDTINAGYGDDIINGGTGNDTINAGNGNDTLIGGKGNDQLNGDSGDDTYIYNLGDGNDTITENYGEDKIVFGEGITFDDLSFVCDGDNLTIIVNEDKNQSITIYRYFNQSQYQVESLEFADGSQYYLNDIDFVYNNQSDKSTVINGGEWDDTINSGAGNDTINSKEGYDTINAGAGNDTVNAGGGNDRITGGKGNDILNGGSGDDIYYYNIGDGVDTINENASEGRDKIVFGAGIAKSDLTFTQNGNNLVITIKNDPNQRITIVNQYHNNQYKVEEIQLSDGSIIDLKTSGLVYTQNNFSETITGTDGSDTIYAAGGNDIINSGNGNDIVYGGQGNDTINAGAGNDQLYGNKGNDILNGGAGNDVYVWELGDGLDTITEENGNDTIKFGEGISSANLSYRQDNNDLIILVNNDSDQGILISNFFRGNQYRVENIEFADGTIIKLDQSGFTFDQKDFSETINGTAFDDIINVNDGNDTINSVAGNDTINGGNGDDTITSEAGDDIISGGKGNDNINGGEGNDTYIYNIGDGLDTITDNEGASDCIKFGSQITWSNLSFRAEGNDLRIILFNDDAQGLLIKNALSNSSYSIEYLEFADGTIVNFNQIGLTLNQKGFAETIDATQFDDIIYGGAGNDTINAKGGNDTIYGQDGNDTINAGNGNDIISGGTGNDILNGEAGDDTYLWNLGDGLDTITDTSGMDKIKFGTGISLEDIKFRIQGNNLLIYVKDNESQGLLIKNMNNSSSNMIEKLEFADNSTFDLVNIGLTYNQGNSHETITAGSFDDVIISGSGNSTINAGNGNDTIIAGAGNDTVNGGEGNDTIAGGTGRDILNGGKGNDTYIYNIGDGFDQINETSGNDKILFGSGIIKSDIKFVADGNDLKLFVKNNPTDCIVIKGYFENSNNKVERIEFNDESYLDIAGLNLSNQSNKSENINGTIYDDTIFGMGGNDTINGGEGNDILNGGSGNDNITGGLGDNEITGGTGRDTLNGGTDDDTYFYNIGDGYDTITDSQGNDKIVFGDGISQSDLTFRAKGNDLILTIQNNTQQIKIVNYFSDANYRIESLQFADGSTINLASSSLLYNQHDISETINTLSGNDTIFAGKGNDTINTSDGNDSVYGGDGDDTINTGNGDDTLIGGKGNDTLIGGAGNDIYEYNLGDGFDTITDSLGSDRIVFGTGINFDDLTFRCENGNLRVVINGDESQGFVITNFLSDANYKIERLQFADGSSKNLRSLGLTFHQKDSSETITGTSYNDIIYAAAGDDIIEAESGNDTIYGEAGNDTINAGAGNDNIYGGKGNDILNGGSGDDTYHYNLGDGLDTISDSLGTDKIIFGEGISRSNLTFRREDNNLRILINGEDSQGILINNHFASNNNTIESISFADNTNINLLTDGLVLTQSDHNDTVVGTNYDDTIYGNSGNDNISGGYGNDHLYGGKGQDILNGGNGDDTYHYNLGDGYDTINETVGTDKIVFGEGIAYDDLTFTRHGNDLHICINSEDYIKITNYYTSDTIESLEFADSSVISLTPDNIILTPLTEEDQIIKGTAGNDEIHGGAGNDNIDALGGNDIVYGGAGDDYINIDNGTNIVYGGLGNDYINGSSGNDTYHYDLGDGFDTIAEYNGSNDRIVFGEGITKDDLNFYVDGQGLKILINNNENQGIFLSNFYQNSNTRIEILEFADGTSMNLNTESIPFSPSDDNDILNGTGYNDILDGGNGNDKIYGNDGNDILNGGNGNDHIEGGYGNDIIAGGKGDDYFVGGRGEDTYIYNLGDGMDTIDNNDSYNNTSDKIKFGEGITFADLTFRTENNNLRIIIKGDESQGILILNHQQGGYYRMGNLEFADGSIFNMINSGLTFHQTNGNESLNGTDYNDIMYLDAGNDIAHGNNGNDIIYGEAGVDKLYGESGDDTLIGGTGNDYLEGGRGTDTYIYNLGDGFDTINNYDSGNNGKDKILFGEGIVQSDLSFSCDGNDLLITVKNNPEQGMRITNHFSPNDSHYRLGKIEFADGTILDLETTGLSLIQTDADDTINATSKNDIIETNGGNDYISAGNGNDIIDAGDGDDTVHGGAGNDDITGGKGDDILDGGTGADIYRYNLGDGFDTINDYDGYGSNIDKIIFGEGILPENITFRNDNNSLRIIINGDETQGMLINNFFDESYSSYYRIEQFVFADGTIMNNTQMGLELSQLDTDESIRGTVYNDIIHAGKGNDIVYALEGNDVIDGGDGDDTIYGGNGKNDITGGKGDDILDGGTGADIYRYNLGDGFDTINDYDSNGSNIDKIIFGEGILPENVTFRNDNNSLRIIINGDETQGMLINNFFDESYSSYYRIEQFVFADGTIMNNAQMGLTLTQTDENEIIRSTEYNDIIYAGKGNDTIQALGGNDIINAGDGDDTVYGGYGNDDITGGKGNDYLDGGSGADIYRYNLGDGFDTINDYDSNSSNKDKIIFGEGILPDDLSFRNDNGSLRIIVKGDETQGILINGFFDDSYASYYRIEQIEFADGTVWETNSIGYKFDQTDDSEYIKAGEYDDVINANKGNDTIYTYGGNDIINGGDGDDKIYAGSGDDIITGGHGNDRLEGYRGSDTYIYNIGDGFDTINDYDDSGVAATDKIIFGEGITLDRLTFSQQDDGLKILIDGDESQGIYIEGYYSESYAYRYKIEQIEFADGSVLDLTTTGLTMIQNNGNAIVKGSDFADNITGDSSNNTIYGYNGNDTINGGDGNDTIYAGSGDDIITGGHGNDRLEGYRGSDTYIYNIGDGFDTINDYDDSGVAATDKIIFGEGITLDRLTFYQQDDGLKILIDGDENQGIYIEGYFNDSYAYRYKIEQIEFADGSVLDLTTTGLTMIQNNGNAIVKGSDFADNITGDSSDNTIYGYNGNDTINGGDGNDTIYAGSGDDIITGGHGNDQLEGSLGSDTYLYNIGDGFDTINDDDNTNTGAIDKIVFGEGISQTDLSFRNDGDDLIITIKGNAEQGIRIVGIYGSYAANHYIEYLEFADGTSMNLPKIGLTFTQNNGDETIKTTSYDDTIYAGEGHDIIYAYGGNDTIYGGDGNDYIEAGNGNDTIHGGKGNDTLIGGSGNDTYYYELGDGWDTIEDNDATANNNDKIVFGEGISFSDLTFTQRDTNLEIMIKGKSDQGITINRFFDPSYRTNFCIEQLGFADGSVIDVPSLGLTLNQTDGSETIYGSGNADTINANGGNDTIYGYGGNDIINGGSGKDTIYAGSGNDIITGGLGDDYIEGSTGNDIYIYNLGDGLDTILDNDSTVDNLDIIRFGTGISQSDLSFKQCDDDLYITIKGDETQGIHISSFFDPSHRTNFCIEKLEFTDGSSIDFRNTGITFSQTDTADNVSGTAFDDTVYAGGGNDTISTGNGHDTIYGGSGNDVINAGSGNDFIVGGTGNDTIDGGSGNDTYTYNLGDGFDRITDSAGSDKIIFGDGISQDNLSFYNDNGSLRIIVDGDEEQGISINKHFSDQNYRIETLQFSDGSTLNINSADLLVQALSTFGASNSASTDVLSNPTQDVSDMYNLATNNELGKKAI